MGFLGTQRFELIRKLGEGGMGLVYEAHDRVRDMRVALKTLRELDASSLYRFKREFRALNDISHPNIVGIYELVSEGDDWLFTMEIVDGVDFIGWIRPPGWRAPSVDELHSLPTAMITASRGSNPIGAITPMPIQRLPIDEVAQLPRLRAALAQLADALHGLHSAGLVHRDLKPSNVRVTPGGRLVLMDFGIAAQASMLGDGDLGMSGTPAFMAPEQATRDVPTAAADWYSFGVMLYLAVTGRLPFAGSAEAVLVAKQTNDVVPPTELVDGIPADLAELCVALLQRDPALRPDGADVLRRLGVASEVDGRTEAPESSRRMFVGRDQELDELRRAFAEAKGGRTIATFIRGVSGMGKSTLVRRFLDEIEGESAIVLKGRCHERESLPYKAWDGVIDSLTHTLMRMPAERVQALLPDEVDLLPRLFPVLRRVPGIQQARALGLYDVHELRVRAFAALSELLRRLCAEQPVLVYIDDLQWADRDSLQLLVELFRDPAAPHVMFLATMRAENYASDPALGAALAQVATHHRAVELELGPLSATEQRALVSRMLGSAAADNEYFFRESAGSPLFLSELVRYTREHGGSVAAAERTSLEDVLYSRIAALPVPACTLLEVVAVAGEPAPLAVLGDAVGLGAADRERALAVLRVTTLVRVARYGREPWLAPYHDRVRETLTSRLDAERMGTLHRRLAEVLERWDEATVDALARHWLAAGDPKQASAYLIKAARAASEKLAFDRAAELYRAALQCGPYAPDEQRQLARQYADALSLAGRASEASDEYQRAASLAAGDEALDLRRLSAENQLRAGRVKEGLVQLRRVVEELGMPVAPTRRRAILALAWSRIRLALRGRRYRRRSAADVPASALARLDTLYRMSMAVGMIDHLFGADLQSRHVRAALDLGEERTACRALAIEAIYGATLGGRSMRRSEALLPALEIDANRMDDAQLRGATQFAVAAVHLYSQRYRLAASHFAQAERAFSAAVGSGWERVTARYLLTLSQLTAGSFDEAARAISRYIEEAERKKDLYAQAMFKTVPLTWCRLRDDDPSGADGHVEAALDGWPDDEFYMAHYYQLTARIMLRLYQGDGAAAHRLFLDARRGLRQSLISRVKWNYADLQRHVLRAAFAVGDEACVKRELGAFRRLRAVVADGYVALYEAAIAARARRRDHSERQLAVAARLFDEADFPHLAAATRYRLGQLLGGRAGERLEAEGISWMESQSVKHPVRMIELLTPPIVRQASGC